MVFAETRGDNIFVDRNDFNDRFFKILFHPLFSFLKIY